MSARRQLHLGVSPAFLLAPGALLAADNTPAAVSILGHGGVRVLVSVGIGGITFDTTNKIEIKLRAGDGTVGNHVAVASTDIECQAASGVGSAVAAGGIVVNLIAAHAAAAVYVFDYVNTDPAITHLSLLADFSGTHGTGTAISVIVERYKGRTENPVA